VTVVNARFARPLDLDTMASVVRRHRAVLIAEDHSVAGGFGSAVLEALCGLGLDAAHVRLAGVAAEPVSHASREEQLAAYGLDARGLARRVRSLLGRDASP
jgi:1-deoxy-D-xylulose-5-phosphate synthase